MPWVGAQQPHRHREGGGLAGAVRPQQAVEGAGRDVQVQPGDGDLGVKALDEPAQGERGLRRACGRGGHGVDVSAPALPVGAAGRLTRIRHPAAAGVSWALPTTPMVPPCRSTTQRAMDSPRPVPPPVARSPRVNRSKTRCRSSGGMPGPSSRTSR